MKAITHTWLFTLLLLVGCGGGGSTPTQEQIDAATDEEEQVSLELARDFDFDVSYEVTITFTPPTGEEGAFHLFSERVAEIEEVIAEPSSKFATISHTITSETFTINRNWSTLYIEWHPTTADAEQQSLAIELDGQTQLNVQFN